MLSELDQNAIVFTCGDNDTFAPWIIQTIKGFRKDVTVLNTSLMLKKDYRDKVFKEIGIPAYTGDVDLQKIKTDSEYTQFVKSLHQHIFDQTPSHPVYVSITCFHQFENDHANKLFLTGLAYKYSEESFDNISLIRRNFEKRYLTDHLKESFDYNIANKIAIQYNAMYLPSLVKLYKHYGKSEELYKQKELRKLLINISEKSGQQGEISEILGSNDKQSLDYFKSALIDVKGIEEKMISLEGNIYMGAHEVSNSDYLKFLSNLLRSRKLELFNTCLYDSAQWVERFKESYNEPMQNLYHAHPAYGDYPVVNIKHEAAVAYCEWLSKQYNSQRKREYTQVRFRLPNEVEWTKAASISESSTSGLPDDNLRDRKGCYLANIKSGEQNYAEDGAMYTAKVDSYKPNEQGFFCIIGNVSEMLNKPGIAKGGSWYHTFNECGLKQLQTYSNCDPGVGFRLVMEVLEK
jgi:ribosomal protein L5